MRATKKNIANVIEQLKASRGCVKKAAVALMPDIDTESARTTLEGFITKNNLRGILSEVRDGCKITRGLKALSKYDQLIEDGFWPAVRHEIVTNDLIALVERKEISGPNNGPLQYQVVEKQWQQEPSKLNGHTSGKGNLLAARRNGKLSEQEDVAAKR